MKLGIKLLYDQTIPILDIYHAGWLRAKGGYATFLSSGVGELEFPLE